MMISAMAVGEAIMYIRVWALGGNTKKLGVALLAQFLGVHVTIYTLLGTFLSNVEYQPSNPLALVACMPKGPDPGTLRYIYVVVVASESMIMIISTAIAFVRYRASNNRLLFAFHKDGILYFIILAVVATTNIIFDSVAPLEYKFCLHSILSCRLILHLHEVNEKELAVTASEEHSSTIHFRSDASVVSMSTIAFEAGELPREMENGIKDCKGLF
ncbi:hypothetical protein DFP72DRAFT_885555, partial [Ephemerocybe angulata]